MTNGFGQEGYGTHKGRPTNSSLMNPLTDRSWSQPSWDGPQRVTYHGLEGKHAVIYVFNPGSVTPDCVPVLPDVQLLRLEVQHHPT